MRGVSINIDYGDIISFSSILETKGKFSIISPQIVDKMIDRIDRNNHN